MVLARKGKIGSIAAKPFASFVSSATIGTRFEGSIVVLLTSDSEITISNFPTDRYTAAQVAGLKDFKKDNPQVLVPRNDTTTTYVAFPNDRRCPRL